MTDDRRRFLGAALGAGLLTLPAGPVRAEDKPKKKDEPEEEVGAAEDLMREHGVLNRILLIYEEGLRRLRAKEDVAPDVFHKPATLVRKFVEDYHEKLEEKFIFPEFEKAKKLADLVKVLREQHEAGRRVTDVILRNADRRPVPQGGRAARSWWPRAARRSSACTARTRPARTRCCSRPCTRSSRPKRFKELGEQFEKEEDRLFGEEGFEKTVDQVAAIEKQLGIYDLAQFTPK